MKSLRTLSAVVAVACIALVTFLFFELRTPALVSKLMASSAFIALAFQGGAQHSWYGRLILLGLVFSWFGDMFLTNATQTAFLLGLGAFLLAHITYVAAFVTHGYDRRWVIVTAIPLAAIAIAVWAWLEPSTAPYLSIPVRTYIAAITVMVILAFGTQGCGGSRYIAVGAVLFFLSDLSVAALRLLETPYATYLVGLPAYYAGQVCLALSVSQSRSH